MWWRPISSTPRSIHPSSNFTPSCKSCSVYIWMNAVVCVHACMHACLYSRPGCRCSGKQTDSRWIHLMSVSCFADILLAAKNTWSVSCCVARSQGEKGGQRKRVREGGAAGVIRNLHIMHVRRKMHRVLVALYVTEHCFGIGALFLAGAVAVPMSVPMAVPIMQCVCVHISAVCPSVCLCVCTACM